MIRFHVPLPPRSLRDNSSAHWSKKKSDADSYSETVYHESQYQVFHQDRRDLGDLPWAAARVTYTWRYATSAPDHSNLGRHTKYLQDIICRAPKLSPERAAKYSRWHLGIVDDDAGITATFKLEKVAHRADECVLVEIERVLP